MNDEDLNKLAIELSETMRFIETSTIEEKAKVLYCLLTIPWGGERELTFMPDPVKLSSNNEVAPQDLPDMFTMDFDNVPEFAEFKEICKFCDGDAFGCVEDEHGERLSIVSLSYMNSIAINFVGNIDRDAFWTYYDIGTEAFENYYGY